MLFFKSLTIAFVAFMLLTIGFGMAMDGFKHEAFHRGYMVECAGVEGYYWECEE